MKIILNLLAILLVVLLVNLSLSAQTTSFTPAVVAAAAMEVSQTDPITGPSLPIVGMFYSAQDPGLLPTPGNFYNLPVWDLGNRIYLLDDFDSDLQLQSKAGGRQMDDAPSPPGGGGGDGTNSSGNSGFTYVTPTNGLWLQINGVTNGVASLTLNNATDMVYEIFSAPALTNPIPGNIEQEVWALTNQTSSPFIVEIQNRTNNLFFWARDWTGVTSNGNQTPDWWFYWYFGTIDLTDTNEAPDGGELVWYYEAGSDPNVISFWLSSASQCVNTPNAPIQVNVLVGQPSYVAALVDSTNWADANWLPYNSNVFVNVGDTEGLHTIWVGLKGLPPNAQQTWSTLQLKLVTTPPVLIITNPAVSTVMQPVIEIQGFSLEPLIGLSFTISNAAGVFSNQPAVVLSRYYDTNLQHFTTNTFQAFDVPLTNGANVITFYATDPAGNVTVTNCAYTLDYSGKTNPPAIQVYWPQNGDQVSGAAFTLRGYLDDFTASLTAEIIDSSGNTNSLQGLVERNGLFWVENASLLAGTNYITLTATDAAGNIATTNLTINCISFALTIDDFSDELGGQPYNILPIVTGTINLTNYTLWVNGVEAIQNGDGTWVAYSVPVGRGGTAVVEARAIPDSDNNGNGEVSYSSTDGTPGNPTAAGSIAAQAQIDQPSMVYVQNYEHTFTSEETDSFYYSDCTHTDTETAFGQTCWDFLGGGTGTFTDSDVDSGCGDNGAFFANETLIWPVDVWYPTESVSATYIDSDSTNIFMCSPGEALNYPEPADFPGEMVQAEWSLTEHSTWSGTDGEGIPVTETSDDSETIASTTMLFTGGKGVSQLQNLFEIDVSALSYTSRVTENGAWTPGWYDSPVPSAGITVAGKTPNSNGQIFTILPDNTTMDITPQAPPQRYTYGVGAIKYNSHLNVFVRQPWPYYPNYDFGDGAPPLGYPIYAIGFGAGHVWWQLVNDAPLVAISQFATPNLSQWLNQQVGYSPSNAVFISHVPPVKQGPGYLDTDNGTLVNVQRTYAIGFPELISGLGDVDNLFNDPGTWNSDENNCVHQTVKEGNTVGVGLPKVYDPEFFGFDLPPSNP